MKPIETYLHECMSEHDMTRRRAAAAIAQFLAMREGLKGRLEDGRLDDTAAQLTAAVIASTWGAPDADGARTAPVGSQAFATCMPACRSGAD